MRPLWFFIGFLVLVVILAARVPASWLASVAEQALPGWEIYGEKGTLWSGSAEDVTAAIEGRRLLLGKVTWALEPSSLLRMQMCGTLSSRLNQQQADSIFCIDPSGELTLTDTKARFPAAVIAGVSSLPVELDGMIDGSFSEMRLRQDALISATGQVDWTTARLSQGADSFLLGSYTAQVSTPEPGNIVVDVFDTDGPIGVEVQAGYGESSWSLKGRLSPRGPAAGEVGYLLNSFGFPRQGESFLVDLSMNY